MKLFKDLLRLCPALALDALRHHRRRCLRNSAPRALKRHIADGVAVDLQIDREMISAQRVIPLGLLVGIGQLAVISRLLAVLQDDLLVEVAQVRHQPKTSRTLFRPSTSASTSARVLYSPKEPPLSPETPSLATPAWPSDGPSRRA